VWRVRAGRRAGKHRRAPARSGFFSGAAAAVNSEWWKPPGKRKPQAGLEKPGPASGWRGNLHNAEEEGDVIHAFVL